MSYLFSVSMRFYAVLLLVAMRFFLLLPLCDCTCWEAVLYSVFAEI